MVQLRHQPGLITRPGSDFILGRELLVENLDGHPVNEAILRADFSKVDRSKAPLSERTKQLDSA